VRAALDRAVAGTVPFTVTVAELGAFPSPGRARVIWAGITDGAAELTRLAGRVDRELAAIAFPADDRPFSPHVTLGRVREPRRQPRLADALAPRAAPFGAVAVDRLCLMRSQLSPRGARYSELSVHRFA
jgi:2'-5' RNA ligase